MKKNSYYFKTQSGVVIHYESYGEGTPILIIPGIACTTQFFKNSIEDLSMKNRLILVDCRGHGLSSKAIHGMDVETFAQDISELINHLDLNDLLIMGWSMGGSIALSYIEQFGGSRLQGLGLIDSVLNCLTDEDYNSHRYRGYNTEALNEYIINSYSDYKIFSENFARRIFKTPPKESTVEWMQKEIMKTPPWIHAAIYTNYVFRDSLPILESVDIPVLFTYGNSISIPNSVKSAKYYQSKVKPYSEVHEFIEGGHMLAYVEAKKFNKVVMKFIDTIKTKNIG